MANHNTQIEWTHIPGYKGETWNPVRGCRRVSEGCQNCYAELMAARFSGEGQPYEGLAKMTPAGPRWTGKGMVVDHHLDDPLRWQKPRAVFVNSMSDLFFEGFSFEVIAGIFGIMAAAPDHIFMVLTKRPERMSEFFHWLCSDNGYDDDPLETCLFLASWAIEDTEHEAWERQIELRSRAGEWPAPNVWLGVSVEHQEAADERVPYLMQVPAAVRFLSCEPLLGPVDLRWHSEMNFAPLREDRVECTECDASFQFGLDEEVPDLCPAIPWIERDTGAKCRGELQVTHGHDRIDWVIAGGESGPGARPMHPDWARQLRDQCAEAGTAFFFKQWGAFRPAILGQALLDDGHPAAPRPQGVISRTGYHWVDQLPEISGLAGGKDAPRWDEDERLLSLRVGKKYAGRELDGRTHDEFPEGNDGQ